MKNINYDLLSSALLGADRMVALFEGLSQVRPPSYPPFNIERVGEDYRLSIAVAGFDESELELYIYNKTLIVEGKKKKSEDQGEYLYRGMAQRNFKFQQPLSDFLEIKRAELTNGMLTVVFSPKEPEELKQKRIPIHTSPISIESNDSASD